MADLQARAAAENLVAELRGEVPRRGFRPELVCIVDDLETGTLLARTPSGTFSLPPLRGLHWLKRWFERWYLRQYR